MDNMSTSDAIIDSIECFIDALEIVINVILLQFTFKMYLIN